MKNYWKQIYEEGLGKTIYVPLKKSIDNSIKGKMNKILTIFTKLFYAIIAFAIAFLLFYVAYPFN